MGHGRPHNPDRPALRLAEVVVNTRPRPRTRATLHHMPGYHELRDHILDFLITRSRTLAGKRPDGWDPKQVPEVRPAAPQSPPPRAAA